MHEPTDLRLPGSGLHPSHFAALRTEILRTGAELSPDQLLNLTDALCSLSGRQQPGTIVQAAGVRAESGPRVFA